MKKNKVDEKQDISKVSSNLLCLLTDQLSLFFLL